MSDMRCPFCQQEYIITKDDSCFGQQRCVCRNPNCEFDGWHFPVKLVSELIRTRKALDVAVDALKNIFDYSKIVSSELQKNHLSQFQTPISKMQYSAQQVLKQITALEQKE